MVRVLGVRGVGEGSRFAVEWPFVWSYLISFQSKLRVLKIRK